jgi:CHAT domain-containing protein/tetratricopeptide (TPR) repeat protein
MRNSSFHLTRPSRVVRAVGAALLIAIPARAEPALEIASRLQADADSLWKVRQYPSAAEAGHRALAIREITVGADHELVAETLTRLGAVWRAMGNLNRADTLLQRAVSIRRQGESPAALASSLNYLAWVRIGQNRRGDAEVLYRECIDVLRRLPEGPDLARNLNSLAGLCHETGRIAEAESLYVATLGTRERVLRPKDMDLAISLSNLASFYQERARFGDAEPLFRRLVEFMERLHGVQSVHVANACNNLANNLREQGRDLEAGELFRKALAIRESQLGPDDPDVGASLNNLAVHYHDLGRYDAAEPLELRAIRILANAPGGAESTEMAAALSNMGLHLQDQGRYGEADSSLRRALWLLEKHHGPSHAVVGGALKNLGNLFVAQERFSEAEPLLRKALDIQRRTMPPEHPEIGRSLIPLGDVYRRQSRLAAADSCYREGLQVLEASLGPTHPDIGGAVGSLASFQATMGRHARAESLFLRSIALIEHSLGASHPGVAVQEAGLGSLYAGTNRPMEALERYSRGMEVEQANLERLFSVSSEPAMRAYLGTMTSSLDRLVSLSLAAGVRHPAIREGAFTWALRRKAIILETLVRFHEARRLLTHDGSISRRAGALRALRDRLSALEMEPDERGSNRTDSLRATLRAERDELEGQLNRALSERLPLDAWVRGSAGRIQSALPAGAALVEYVRSKQFDPRNSVTPWKAARYVAFVLRSGPPRPPTMVDLGDADELDRLIERFRGVLQPGQRWSEWAAVNDQLYRRVFAPVRPAIGASRLVYLAPDGGLNRLPFEALADASGKHLVEVYPFAYLTSGKELLTPPTPPARGTVILAAPDYDRTTKDGLRLASTSLALAGASSSTLRGELREHWDRPEWKQLSGALHEATDVKTALEGSEFGPVSLYTGSMAVEEILKAQSAPRLLHLATHGYFMGGPPERPDTRRGGKAARKVAPRAMRIAGDPLLRSGIVLAGANLIGTTRDSLAGDDGWVTAQEISMLDLRGTELAVLSACDTGLGDVRDGEGVSGLRSAFRCAGAGTLLMSLFKVDDQTTRVLMRRFYQGLREGLGKLAALRRAQLELMRERIRRGQEAQPFYWAGFVLVGDPG